MIDYRLINPDKCDTLIFVHGLASNLNSFSFSIEHFKSDYRILTLSLRGHGRSGCPQPENLKSYCVREMADDVIEVLDELNVHSFHYVGHSMGGIIGYDLYDRHPQNFVSFAACGSPAQIKIPEWIAMAGTSPLKTLPEKMLVAVAGQVISRFSGKTNISKKILRDKVVPYINWRVMRNCMVNLSNFSYLEVLDKIDVPFMLLHGQHDIYNLYIKEIRKAMNGKKNFRYEYMKDAGHNAHLDFPEKFNSILEDFLNKSKKHFLN